MKKEILMLHQKALVSAKTFRKAEHDLLEILQEIDARKVFLHMGYSSLYAYALEELKLSEANAKNFINVARKALEIPLLKQEIKTGNLTLCKARKIVPVLNKENAREWIEKAKKMPKFLLEREVASVLPKEELVHERASFVREDRLRLELGVSETLLEKLHQVQDLLSQKRRKRVKIEEALEAMTQEYLQRNDPVEKDKRRKERLAMKQKKAEEGKNQQKKSKNANLGVPGHLDAWAMHTQNAKRELLTYRIKNQVLARDQHQCTYIHPNGKRCKQRFWLHLHHIKPKTLGGKDHADNLATLCANHHRLIHHHINWKRRRV